jgi:aldehyde dehydrogenase (NAD(P)+)
VVVGAGHLPARAPRITGQLGRSPDDRTTVPLHPLDNYDRTLFLGYESQAWLAPGVDPARLAWHQASFYRQQDPEGHVVLVLGAGNVGSISILDVLYHSFVEGGVCLLKMNPVNAYLGPLYERAFAPLVERGFLSLVHGGAEVGAFLVEHPDVDAIHVTGSVDTHDRIVWGPPGPEREQRKRDGEPLTKKRVTSELGNVSPALIVPARYSDRELDRMARSLSGMVVNNASFNCVALKLLVTARDWPQRAELLARISRVLAQTPTRFAYYPGADARYASLVGGVEPGRVQRIGDTPKGHLPWTLVTELDAGERSPLFEIEPFCSILSEAVFDGGTAPEFLQSATRFVNALVDLRYGTVCINAWPATAYGLGAPPWGGAPGASLADAQSGIGWGHNALLLEQVHKVVLRSPLLSFPEPFWCPGHRHLSDLGRAFSEHEASPGLRRAAQAAWFGVLG